MSHGSATQEVRAVRLIIQPRCPFAALQMFRPIQGPAAVSLLYVVVAADTQIHQGEKCFTSMYGAPLATATGGSACFLSIERQCVPRRSSGLINQSLSQQEEPFPSRYSAVKKYPRPHLTYHTYYFSFFFFFIRFESFRSSNKG